MAKKSNGKAMGGTPFMDNAKGMCSYKNNPLPKANENKPMCGPGMNSDQSKANSLLQRAQRDVDSLRGKGVM